MGANRQHTVIDQVEDLVNENYAFFSAFRTRAEARAAERQGTETDEESENEHERVFREEDDRKRWWLGRLEEWRGSHPTRVFRRICFEATELPAKPEQIAWTCYRRLHAINDTLMKQWLLTPFLVPTGGRPSELLPGAPVGSSLSFENGKEMERYTNIERMGVLARSHPLVSAVSLHCAYRLRPSSAFEAVQGKTIDLKIELAASGATFFTGCTVVKAAEGLLSLWWMPSHCFHLSKGQREQMQAVFFDITEAMRFTPTEFRRLSPCAAAAKEAPSASAEAAEAPQPPPPQPLARKLPRMPVELQLPQSPPVAPQLSPRQESSLPPPQPPPPQHAPVCADRQALPPDVSMPQPLPRTPEQHTPPVATDSHEPPLREPLAPDGSMLQPPPPLTPEQEPPSSTATNFGTTI